MSSVDETIQEIFKYVEMLAKTAPIYVIPPVYLKLAILLPKLVNNVLDSVKPIPTKLRCGKCNAIHIDENEWATRPHRTHLCAYCGHKWRPFPVATIGVHMR